MRTQSRKWFLAAGLLVMGWSCENGPAGPSSPNPVDPSPEVPGVLEVSITTSGTRPDLDGFTVALSVGEGAPSLQLVGHTGGRVLFSDLPPGTHSIRMESLAPNCSVQGANPRQVTIAAGGTLQVGFAVFCPGPGAVLVKTITTGSDLDDDGYTLAFWASSTREETPIGASDSLWISEEDLPPGTSLVVLEGIAANCWATSGRGSTFFLRGDATTRVEFSIECMPWAVYNSGIIYDRVTPTSYGLSEQYILLSNNRFRLRFFGGGREAFEYLGSYHSSDSMISFAFDEPNWAAIGTVRGDSLFVDYNDHANLSDFEDGSFVRSPQ